MKPKSLNNRIALPLLRSDQCRVRFLLLKRWRKWRRNSTNQRTNVEHPHKEGLGDKWRLIKEKDNTYRYLSGQGEGWSVAHRRERSSMWSASWEPLTGQPCKWSSRTSLLKAAAPSALWQGHAPEQVASLLKTTHVPTSVAKCRKVVKWPTSAAKWC